MKILAPPGWGFPPNYPLAGITAEDLPELPMLRVLRREARTDAIVAAICEVPGLAQSIRVVDLTRKYGLPQGTASQALNRARMGLA